MAGALLSALALARTAGEEEGLVIGESSADASVSTSSSRRTPGGVSRWGGFPPSCPWGAPRIGAADGAGSGAGPRARQGRGSRAEGCGRPATAPAELVRAAPPRPPVAPWRECLRRLGERGDAAADAGQRRRRLFRALDASLPHARESGAGQRTSCAPDLAGARLLLPRAAAAGGGPVHLPGARRTAAPRRDHVADDPRHRTLLRRRDREHRPRGPHADRRRQRGARPVSPVRAAGRSVEARPEPR